MEYFYEDCYSSKNRFIRYYYQCKPEDEIAHRIFKEGFMIKNNILTVNNLYTFMGSKIGYKTKTALNTISKDEFDSILILRNMYIRFYKEQFIYYEKQILLMNRQNKNKSTKDDTKPDGQGVGLTRGFV